MSSSKPSKPWTARIGNSAQILREDSTEGDLSLLGRGNDGGFGPSASRKLSPSKATSRTSGFPQGSSSSSNRNISPFPERSPGRDHLRANELRGQTSTDVPQGSNTTLDASWSQDNLPSQKDGADWYIEGPGRRVGYDDMTAIDWIFEYTKERQRLRRLLANSHGLLGNVRQLLDASYVWFVLVLTGISIGVLAAAINIASDWLGDIKMGFCKASAGRGQFYLNRQFCCWGHDEFAQCQDWTPWRTALHVNSAGGGYVVEYIMFVLFSISFAISAAVLVQKYSIYAKHSGIPEIKTVLGGFVMKRFLGGWTLVSKSVGLCLAVSSGLWLGKEGPLVHLACCCSNTIMNLFETLKHNEARKREVLSAAAASGISVAFGSPIGGVLFSLEQLSYYFPDKTMWQSFVCAMVAAVTLQALNPFHTGKIVLYQVTYTTGWHSFEIIPFIILGITGGIYGGLFIRLNMFVERLRRSKTYPFHSKPILEVLVFTMLMALVNFPNVFMRSQLSELVSYLFAECAAIGNNDIFGLCKATTAGSLSMASLLLTASCLGFLFASITFGLQIPAGIMLPSLAIGALYGRALGVAVELIHRHFSTSVLFAACEPDVACITPGTYAIVGAASALAGVTRMTVSIVVIMFELTGALTYVLPIMVAVMLAKWIGDALSSRGIYESWIQINEYPYLDNKDDAKIPHVSVSSMMTRSEEMTCFDANKQYTVADLENVLRTTNFRGYPVVASRRSSTSISEEASDSHSVTHDNILIGYISRVELSYALNPTTSVSGSLSTRSDTEPRGSETPCYFTYRHDVSETQSLDLRPWLDQTPITLNVNGPFQLAVSMFQNLGLRYLLLVDRGAFQGILTKKDVWWVLNASGDTTMPEDIVPGTGGLRETDDADDGEEEARGLLRDG